MLEVHKGGRKMGYKFSRLQTERKEVLRQGCAWRERGRDLLEGWVKKDRGERSERIFNSSYYSA